MQAAVIHIANRVTFWREVCVNCRRASKTTKAVKAATKKSYALRRT
jgi:hypothetical protein